MKKIITSRGFILGLITLFSFNLMSCNKTQTEFIEVGLDFNQNNSVQGLYDSFDTGLRVKKGSDSTQSIEVFYFNSVLQGFENTLNRAELVDRNQNLEFKLYREVRKYVNFREETKSKEIYSFTSTLEYFFSEKFDACDPKSLIDTVTVDDLYADYIDYANISYHFTITPVDDEPVKIFFLRNEILEPIYGNKIKGFHTFIEYTLNEKNQITFLEREEIKENVNI